VARKQKATLRNLFSDANDEDDLEAVRARFAAVEIKKSQPWWPQDRSVAELALQMALVVEQLGCSPTIGDWTQVRSAATDQIRRCIHTCRHFLLPTQLCVLAPVVNSLTVHI